MRKILAGFLATSMVVSMSAMVSAATTSPSVTLSTQKMEITPVTTVTGTIATVNGGKNTITVDTKFTGLTLNFKDAANKDAGSVLVSLDESFVSTLTASISGGAVHFVNNDVSGDTAGVKATLLTPAQIQTVLAGKSFSSAKIDGKIYSGKLVKGAGTSIGVQLDGSKLSTGVTASAALDSTSTVNYSNLEVRDSGDNVLPISGVTNAITQSGVVTNATVVVGDAGETADVEITGDYFAKLGLKNVVWCDGNGNPLPMTEKGAGVDKDLNGSDGVQSDRTLYFMINDSEVATFNDDNFWKVKVSKGDNGKIIKEVTDTTKIFSAPLVNANNGSSINNIDFTKRHRYIKVKLNEIYTDDEYKVTLDLRLSPTSRAEEKYNISGDEIKVKDFAFWVKNIVKSADSDWRVGLSGLMLSPVTNDWNNVTYHDEESDVAFLRFFGDSDVDKFYAKLSTKWTHDDYAAYFNDQDAFYFEFTGSPKMSSTSRADLQIYDPFIDEDGNSTFDASTATIYQIVDGDLVDVTSSFTYGEGYNGDNAFITRTRFLGSYIICEKPVEEAVGEENIDDLMPGDEEIPVAPEMTPDNNAGGKNPANTGRYA